MSIKIIIGNSYSEIENADKRTLTDLSRLMSYEMPGAAFSKLPQYLKYKKLLSVKNGIGEFPTGLLDLTKKYLNENGLSFTESDTRIRPKAKKVYQVMNRRSLPPLREYQKEIIKSCIENERGIVSVCTGAGKTRCAMELIAELSVPTLFLVPNLSLLNQTYALLSDFFGKRMVGRAGGGKSVLDREIVVATPQSIAKAPPEFWKNIDLVIYDEFHHSSMETHQQLNKNCFEDIYYRIGLTATPFRSDGSDLAMHGILSNTIYKYSVIDGIKDGFLTKPYFFIYHYDHDAGLSFNTGVAQKDYKAEYDARIINNDNYHSFVANIAQKTLDKNVSTVIFVTSIEHGERLNKLIPGSVFINGEELSESNKQQIKDFNEGKILCLIGTSIIGEGVDLVKAQCGIMAGGGKSKGGLIQQVGRLLRLCPGKEFCTVIDFMHKNSKYPLRHSKERVKVYREFESDIVDVI